jgi:valyl-tRNA synthetase
MPTAPADLPKQYDHAAAQERWYRFWEENGYFHSRPNPAKQPYCIVIPPPNVTGALHLGHALNNTLQDILIRQKRMQGFEALWVPGTDHAGIATQAVVERRLLEEEKLSRHELGRQGLVARIWQWKDAYEARILGQLKEMGCSCDWQRTRFTLDPVCARAVRHTFFKMFRDGLIYRGKRLVNWDTFLQTAVSDDEVFHEAVKGHFWHIKYPVAPEHRKPGWPEHVTVATTRPETMLGDTAVAVHPDPAGALSRAQEDLRRRLADAPAKDKLDLQAQIDEVERRQRKMLPQLEKLRDMALAGVMLELPLTGRKIPLIADRWAKPELGSGCVKITPAHDQNDYDVWQRHLEIGAVNILNPDGTLNNNVPEKYRGMTVKAARNAVEADLDAAALVLEKEDREIDLGHSDRSKTPIEPYLTDQWFIKMGQLAQTAIEAVTSGRVRIIPERYAKGYLDWLSEKRDWPIGRQLWWGHQIPVWHKARAATSEQERQLASRIREWMRRGRVAEGFYEGSLSRALSAPPSVAAYYLCVADEEDTEIVAELEKDGFFVRDPDVLDTWFSSALWPHSTLGWPEKTPELAYYYPTSVLITSRDIITLWVARMVLTGLYNVGDIPFHDVFIHPKILDAYGEGMSKSKGNGVDPIDVIEKFGADSLRFGLAYLTTETQDIRMPVEFECPHCRALVEQTKENRTRPRIKCSHCGKEFSTQWAEKPADKALPRGAVVSDRFELARNFCNKLWNAARFALMNLEGYTPQPVAEGELCVEDRWILGRLASVTRETTRALDEYRYADAARVLYGFAWDEFCSFYVEMVKSRLAPQDLPSPLAGEAPTSGYPGVRGAEATSAALGHPPSPYPLPEGEGTSDRAVAQRVLAHTLDVLLRLLHPLVPFVTEEVWQLLAAVAPERGLAEVGPAARSIMIAPWPECDPARQDAQIEARFARFQEVLRAVRDIRGRQNVPPRKPIEFLVRSDAATAELLRPMEPYFRAMAAARPIGWGPDVAAPALAANVALPGLEVFVDLAGLIDVEVETRRQEQEMVRLNGLIAAKRKKLENKNFVDRAPAAVVQAERDGLRDLESQHAAAAAVLNRLRPA